jgi:hypothetical protein
MKPLRKHKILRRLYRDEGGQAIVFGTISLLFIIIAVVMVFQMGMLVDRRVQAQDAADAAAYSGAVTKAAIANQIEGLNSGMAYIYRRMLEYEYDSMYFSGASYTGEMEDYANFGTAYTQASEWIERGTRWMQRLAQMEEGKANAAPRLVEQAVYEVARKNGAQAVAIWPNAPEYEAFNRREDHLNCVFQRQGPASWTVESNSDYIAVLQRSGPAAFLFTMRDNEAANNGVNARDAVGVRISGTTVSGIGPGGGPGGPGGPGVSGNPMILFGNSVYFYDGTRYIVGLSRMQLPGDPPVEILVFNYGDNTQDYVDLASAQQASGVTLSHWYRYVNVQWTVRMFRVRPRWSDTDIWVLVAYLNTVRLSYDSTFVQSNPFYTYMYGSFSNGALSANYEIAGDVVTVDGPGTTTPMGNLTLYEDSVGIGTSGAPPQFVEDTVARFHNRGVTAPAGAPIDTALARTRMSDDYTTRVLTYDANQDADLMQGITQAMSWPAYNGASDYQSLDLTRLPLPLAVTDEFFRYGVNVGVWMPPQESVPLLTNPPHGFFAVASAALGRRAVAGGNMLTPPDSDLLLVNVSDGTRTRATDVKYPYVKTFDNAADRWSATATQSPQGNWYAVLVPVKTAIMEDDLDGSAGSYASSAQLIFDKLVHCDWRNTGTGGAEDQIPQMLEQIEKPQFNPVIRPEEEYYDPNLSQSPPFEYTGEDFDNTVQH